MLKRIENWFNTKFGWFFTNGNKTLKPTDVKLKKSISNCSNSSIKKVLEKKKEIEYSFGERDENGFCDLIVDGEKTDVKVLVFTSEQVNKIREIQKQSWGENW
jgi:hypothetical protein